MALGLTLLGLGYMWATRHVGSTGGTQQAAGQLDFALSGGLAVCLIKLELRLLRRFLRQRGLGGRVPCSRNPVGFLYAGNFVCSLVGAVKIKPPQQFSVVGGCEAHRLVGGLSERRHTE